MTHVVEKLSDGQVMVEADILSSVPLSSNIVDAGGNRYRGIVVIQGPWSKEAKHIAAQRAMREYAGLFIDEAMNNPRLNWNPRLFDRTRQETKDRAHLLTERTKTTLINFVETELRVGDYTRAGLNAVDDGNARIILLTSWGLMESFHADLTLNGAQDSKVITERQRYQMEQEAREVANRWNPDDHRIGGNKPLHYAAFGWGQERKTHDHYGDLRIMIRRDYGLPMSPTEMERKRGYEIGLCDPINGVNSQESFHHVSYGQIITINIRYRPEETLDALDDIFTNRFMMPMVGRLVQGNETARYLYSENLDGLDKDGNPLADFAVAKAALLDYRHMFNKLAGQKPLVFPDRRTLRVAMSNLRANERLADPIFGILLPDGSFKPVPVGEKPTTA